MAAVFFTNGAVLASWLPRLPEVRDRLGIDIGTLGLALLGGGVGGILGSLIAGRVLDNLGNRRVMIGAGLFSSLGLPLVAAVPGAPALFLVVAYLGFFDVLGDLAMNAQAVVVQARLRRSIMNRMHGIWSLGVLVGSLAGSVAVAIDISLGWHLIGAAVVIIATLLAARPALLADDAGPVGGADELRPGGWNRPAVAMAVLALGAMIVEILPNDWSALFLTDELDAERTAGLGLVAFSAAMLAGRMGGDHVLDAIGSERLYRLAVGLTVSGAVVVVVAPVIPVALIGFVVWGLGVSVLFPQIYALAASLPGASAGAGLGGMALGQRLGSVLAPLATGNLGDASGLRFALAAMVGAGVAAMILARRFAR